MEPALHQLTFLRMTSLCLDIFFCVWWSSDVALSPNLQFSNSLGADVCSCAQGVGEIPTSVQTEIESWTPSPTPDPSSNIIAKLDKVAGGIQHLTGLSPSPGGFSAVSLYCADSISSWSEVWAAFQGKWLQGRRSRSPPKTVW